MESRARCAGFSVTEIGNRKERLRVREAGASAAGRGQRPYASFPDRQPNVTHVTPIKKEAVSEQNAKHSTIETGLRRKACSQIQGGLNRLILIPTMLFRVTRLLCRRGERAPLGLRGLGEDFDFSP